MEALLEQLVEGVVRRLSIEIEASGRHVHLDRRGVDALFGPGYRLTPVKELSQPGQFVCKERVTVEGPKGAIANVVVLGPERKESQVEVSLTDCVTLGVSAPVRLSGQLKGSSGITLRAGNRSVTLERGLVVAQRHIHMTPEDGRRFGLQDGQVVRLKVMSRRPARLDEVPVRISDQFATVAHIDYDEANACGFRKGDRGVILP